MYNVATKPIITKQISNIDIGLSLLFFRPGYAKKHSANPNARWTERAGTSIIFPKSNMNGNGDAYQSWNNDHEIAIVATSFKFQFFNFLLEPPSSSNLSKKFGLSGSGAELIVRQ